MYIIVGCGGNGQTYFMNFLKQNKININDIFDKDGLKHVPSFEILKEKINILGKKGINIKIDKIIFLYNHPYKAIKSHFRRKFEFRQTIKLGNPYNLKKEDTKYENFEKNNYSAK